LQEDWKFSFPNIFCIRHNCNPTRSYLLILSPQMRVWGVVIITGHLNWSHFDSVKSMWPFWEDIAILVALHSFLQASVYNKWRWILPLLYYMMEWYVIRPVKALIEDRDFVPVCLSQHVRVSLSPHLGPCTSAAGSSPHLLHRE